MKSLIVAVAFLALSTSSVFARCNSNYADGVLNTAIKCLGTDRVGLTDIPGTDAAQRAVAGICMDGCYSSLFNADLRPECDKKYAGALVGAKEQIQAYATENKCVFDPDAIQAAAGPAAPAAAEGPFASCYWVSNSAVQPMNNACGVTAACFGMGYCSEGEYSGDALTLQCAATAGGECPTFAECAQADNPSWVTAHKFSRENADNNGAGPTGVIGK